MKIVYDAKTKQVTTEEYEPPKPTKAQQKQNRINEILFELKELDDEIKRYDEDIIEAMYKEFGYVPYETTAEVINRKEDLRDELKSLKETTK